jgi:hypothetical protein
MAAMIEVNPRAVAGGNNPPLSPFEVARKAVEDIYEETVHWLDGKPIDSQPLADGVANLLTEIRKAEKLANDARKAEKDELDRRVAEIQARYAPLIGNTKTAKGKTVIAAEACKAALAPWLEAEALRLEEEARLAREAAVADMAKAAAALRYSDPLDLEDRAEAEELLSAARKQEAMARRLENQTATAGGTTGRSVGLRTSWVATLDDPVMAARHYWRERRTEMLQFLRDLAAADVRLGRHEIPGFTITQERRAV